MVEGGDIPYKPEAAAKQKANYTDRLKLDPEVKCYMGGVPRSTYMPYPFQIVQGTDTMMFVYEYAGAVRVINMKAPTKAPADRSATTRLRGARCTPAGSLRGGSAAEVPAFRRRRRRRRCDRRCAGVA